MLSLCRYFIW